MTKTDLKYSVIYSFDCYKDRSVKEFAPPRSKAWECTEGNEQLDWPEVFPNGKHRKYGAVLNQEQFDKFVDKLGLVASSTETMGSLGAPGCGYGFVPAICFEAEKCGAWVNAYVTPLPLLQIERELTPALPGWKKIVEEQAQAKQRSAWQKIRKDVLENYG